MTNTNTKRLEQDFEQGKTMKCPECKKVISISECRWVEGILTTLRTLRDVNKENSTKIMNVRMSKNGIIQKLHKQVGQLLELMNEEQRKKAKEINQAMRDENKKWEKLNRLK